MKSHILSQAVVAVTLLSSAQAQYYAVDPYFNGQYKVSELNLTLTLTKSVETPLLDLRDQNGGVAKPVQKTWENSYTDSAGKEIYEARTQITKTKYSNVELLNDLKNLGVIESVTGWSVVYLNDNTYMAEWDENYGQIDQDMDSIYGVYLKFKTKTGGFILKDVTEYLDFNPYGENDNSGMDGVEESLEDHVDAYNYLESNNYETQQYSYKETSSTFGIGTATVAISGEPFTLKGTSSLSITWEAPNQTYKDIPTVRGLIGAMNDGESTAVFDGTIAATFGVIGSFSSYQTAIELGNP